MQTTSLDTESTMKRLDIMTVSTRICTSLITLQYLILMKSLSQLRNDIEYAVKLTIMKQETINIIKGNLKSTFDVN